MRNIKFITGPAGTGKSYKLKEMLENERESHLICAPSGMAATAVCGSTLHRTFKINQDSGFVGKRWPDVKKVYIDEASMMGAQLFEAAIIGAPNADFILVGDMAQLPPVKDKFWFQSKYFNQFKLDIEKLTKQYRQAGDTGFTEVLNDIRNGSVSREDLRWMYTNSCHPDDNYDAVTLAYRNDTVRAINAEKLLDLPGELYDNEAQYGGAMRYNDCIAEPLLTLKVNAEVIMLTNHKEGYWSNGTRAKVVKVTDDEVVVTLQDKGKVNYHVQMHTWQMKVPQDVTPLRRSELQELLRTEDDEFKRREIQHWLDTGIEYVVIGTCKQFPMKLAYAMTVHKSQGMTLDSAHVITSGFSGCNGIGYVAVSRVRSLDTLSFDRKPVPADFRINEALKQFI